MSGNLTDMEKRIEELTSELLSLKQRLDSREEPHSEATSDENTRAAAATTADETRNPLPQAVAVPDQTAEIQEITDELLSWAGSASLLPRMATLCFLLVVALILRTITESGLINTLAGSVLGMGYASALMLLGWHKYRRQSPLAPVFAGGGAVLIATIVVETHMHFQSLPIIPAYLTLMATGVLMAVISYRHNAFTPISVGTLSMCLAGAAMDYPNPHFPYMSMILVTANVLGYFAALLKRCAWLRWTVLAVTMIMLHLWSLRLGMAISRNISPSAELAPGLFFPSLAIFAITYLAIALSGILRSGKEQISRFDFSLPTINVVWSFAAAWYVVGAGAGSSHTLSLIALAMAVAHLGIGFWLANRHIERAPGTNSLVFAGTVLLALALPYTFGSTLPSLPILSAFSVILFMLSHNWQSGGVRMTSYLLQIYSSAALAIALYRHTPPEKPLIAAGAAAIVASCGLYHFLQCRKIQPPTPSELFSRLDSKDRSATALLLASLASWFFMLRIGVYQMLLGIPGQLVNSFRCSQSVLINLSAIVLMLVAFRTANKEYRNVAIFITVIGGIKVFLFDLLRGHGLPLVISVFSFGLAAAIESLALGKWQNKTG